MMLSLNEVVTARLLTSLALAAAISAPAIAQDLLILEDGGRREGRLASCVGEVCTLAGEQIRRDEIAWIGLGQTGSPPAPPLLRSADASGKVPSDGDSDRLYLTDGAVVESPLIGVSLGAVATEGGSYDRTDVAWIRIAGAGDAGAAADVLIRRDGDELTGALDGCAGATCTFGATSVPRDEIAWIGLAQESATPPVAQDPDRDEVHLADGTVVPGRVQGVSAEDVVAERGSWPRHEVAWIHLVPDEEVGDSGPFGAPPDREPPPEPPADSSPPPPPPEPPGDEAPPLPQPPLGSPSVTGEGERGALWTGTMTGRTYGVVDGITSEWTTHVEVKLREYRVPLICADRGEVERVGTFMGLEPEGSVVANRFTCHGEGLSCSGQGSVTVSSGRDDSGISHASGIWLKTSDRDLTTCLGYAFDVPLGGGLYQVSVGTRYEDRFTVTWYADGAPPQTTESAFHAPIIGTGLLAQLGAPVRECADPEIRYLEGGNGVMRGSYTAPCTGCCPQAEATWSICREGTDCPPPPSLPSEGGGEAPDPCGELQQIRAPLDLAMDQQRFYLHQVQELLAEHGSLQEQARQWQGDFEHATRDCNLWSAARFLVGLLASGGAPGVGTGALRGAQPIPAIKEFWNFLAMAEKVAAGDPSWMLPNAEFGPGGSEWLSLEDLWDGFRTVYGGLSESAPQELREGLQNCGAPTIEGVLDGAYEYLRLLEQIEPLARRMNEAMNRVRDQDEKMFDLWARYQRDCREYQECKGGDPAACDEWPPPGPLAPALPP